MASDKRVPMIAGNWKMHMTAKEAADLAAAIRKGLDPDLKHEVLLAPTFTALHAVHGALAGSKIFLSSQDVCWEEKGAFTGAVSPSQIKDAGCTHAIIGHSERRKIFLETDEVVNKKMKTAIKDGLVPVLCIGETLEERESQKTYKVLETQLVGAFAGISAAEAARVVIAYEPVWAIGTGKTASGADAAAMAEAIRTALRESGWSAGAADACPILYGGSVTSAAIGEFLAEPSIDGALVGGASLKVDEMAGIVARGGLTARARRGS